LEYDRNKYTAGNIWRSDDGMTVKIPKESLIILDEAHKCKSDNSITSSIMIKFKKEGYKVLLMSATAATLPTEMRAFGFAVNLHNGVGYRNWLNEKVEITQGQFGPSVDMKSLKTQDGMRKIHNELFNLQNVASRLTRLQMKAMFPEWRMRLPDWMNNLRTIGLTCLLK
jgi:hypothetical protein